MGGPQSCVVCVCVQVLVTNQITTTGMSHDTERGSDWSESCGGHISAALGNSWAHSVNTRLLLGYLPQHHRLVGLHQSVVPCLVPGPPPLADSGEEPRECL